MAINPPTVLPPSLPAPVEGGGLAELWRNLLPLDDLQAKSPPERRLTLGRDILPTLAMLSAMGPDGPHLVNTDVIGNVVADSPGYLIDQLTAPVNAGDHAIQVTNGRQFAPGMAVAIGSQQTTADRNPAFQTWVNTVQGNTVNLQNGSPAAFGVGQPVVITTFQAIRYGYNDPLPWTWKDGLNSNDQAQCLIVHAALPGLRYKVDTIIASMIGFGALADGREVQIYDGTVAAGAVFRVAQMSITATVGDKDHFQASRMGWIGSPNTQLTIQFSAAPSVGNLTNLFAGGYLVPAA